MLLEICASTVQSAVNAQKGGAQRIELCAELGLGGITPSYGMIKKVLDLIQIPVFVLIRPRSGDFNYSVLEFEMMKSDFEICKELGCSGIVSGVLNAERKLDVERTKELIELSRPLEFTFHRAFDRVVDPLNALNQLIELGVDRILTSGQKTTAEKGLELLIELKQKSNSKIKILPGSGINLSNIHLFKDNGFAEVHSSASLKPKNENIKEVQSKSPEFRDESNIYESNLELIKEMVKICD